MRQMEADYANKLQTTLELDTMAMLIAGNNLHIVSTGRAGKLLDEFLQVRMQIIKLVLEDDDKELWKTKDDLAKVLQKIMGPEAWKEHQELFGLLSYYWVD